MKRATSVIPDVLIVIGLAAVAVAAGLLSLPAGLAVGGVEAVALGVVLNIDRARAAAAATPPPPPSAVDDALTVERKL